MRTTVSQVASATFGSRPSSAHPGSSHLVQSAYQTDFLPSSDQISPEDLTPHGRRFSSDGHRRAVLEVEQRALLRRRRRHRRQHQVVQRHLSEGKLRSFRT